MVSRKPRKQKEISEEERVSEKEMISLRQAVHILGYKSDGPIYKNKFFELVKSEDGKNYLSKSSIDDFLATHKKVAKGTKNIAKGPAMSREQAVKALMAGVEVAEEQISKGVNLLATGEMGIGNTTPSSAIAAVYT